MTVTTTQGKYSDGCGMTWDSVYVTTYEGDELASVGDFNDKVLAILVKEFGSDISWTFQGGNADGVADSN